MENDFKLFHVFDEVKKKKQTKKTELYGFELRRKQEKIWNLSMNEWNVDSAQCF